jgi:hypothetical protein
LIGNKIIKHRRGVGYFINEKIYWQKCYKFV